MAPNTFEVTCQRYRVYNKDEPFTHMLLTGGKYNFSEEQTVDLTKHPKYTAPSAHNYLDVQSFVRTYVKYYGKLPTELELASLALHWWWSRRTNPAEGISLTTRRSSEFFFLYFDIDMKMAEWDIALWIETQRAIAMVVHHIVSSYYSKDANCDMTVAVTERPRTVKSGKNDVYKVGIHLYFPNLVVNFQEAVLLLQVVTHRIREVRGERDTTRGENTWENVFDASVYRNGLRECFTYKTNPCNKCCNWNNSDYDVNSLYVPTFLVVNNDYVEICDDFAEKRGWVITDSDTGTCYDVSLYNLTRIRCSQSDISKFRHEFCRVQHPLGYIPVEDDVVVCSPSRKRPKYCTESLLQYPLDASCVSKFRNFVILPLTPSEIEKVEEVIRYSFDSTYYHSVQVRNVYAFYSRDKQSTVDVLGQPCRFSHVKITLKGPNSNYCFNKGACHTSNTVYFEITLNTKCTTKGKNDSLLFEQRCWSPHTYKTLDGRDTKPCDKFRSSKDMDVNKVGRVGKSVAKIIFHHPLALSDNSQEENTSLLKNVQKYED